MTMCLSFVDSDKNCILLLPEISSPCFRQGYWCNVLWLLMSNILDQSYLDISY